MAEPNAAAEKNSKVAKGKRAWPTSSVERLLLDIAISIRSREQEQRELG